MIRTDGLLNVIGGVIWKESYIRIKPVNAVFPNEKAKDTFG